MAAPLAPARPRATRDAWQARPALRARAIHAVRVVSDGGCGTVLLSAVVRGRAAGAGGGAEGEGAERAGWLPAGARVAVKAMPKRGMRGGARRAHAARTRALFDLRHRYVNRLVAAFGDADYFYHVFEFLPGGDVYSRLEARDRPFTERQALFIVRQVLHAVAYLHARGCAHRDLKLENIMFATRRDEPVQVVQLIDFDLLLATGGGDGGGSGDGGGDGGGVVPSAVSTDGNGSVRAATSWTTTTSSVSSWEAAAAPPPRRPQSRPVRAELVGTLLYFSPQLAAETVHVPEQSDMWAVGVLLFALLSFSMPYQAATPDAILARLRDPSAAPRFAGDPWSRLSADTTRLTRDLLSRDPDARPTADEAAARVAAIEARLGSASAPAPSTIGARSTSASAAAGFPSMRKLGAHRFARSASGRASARPSHCAPAATSPALSFVSNGPTPTPTPTPTPAAAASSRSELLERYRLPRARAGGADAGPADGRVTRVASDSRHVRSPGAAAGWEGESSAGLLSSTTGCPGAGGPRATSGTAASLQRSSSLRAMVRVVSRSKRNANDVGAPSARDAGRAAPDEPSPSSPSLARSEWHTRLHSPRRVRSYVSFDATCYATPSPPSPPPQAPPAAAAAAREPIEPTEPTEPSGHVQRRQPVRSGRWPETFGQGGVEAFLDGGGVPPAGTTHDARPAIHARLRAASLDRVRSRKRVPPPAAPDEPVDPDAEEPTSNDFFRATSIDLAAMLPRRHAAPPAPPVAPPRPAPFLATTESEEADCTLFVVDRARKGFPAPADGTPSPAPAFSFNARPLVEQRRRPALGGKNILSRRASWSKGSSGSLARRRRSVHRDNNRFSVDVCAPPPGTAPAPAQPSVRASRRERFRPRMKIFGSPARGAAADTDRSGPRRGMFN